MKRLAVLTTSLILTLSAVGGAISAFAEGTEKNETYYPEDLNKILVFTDLLNYEIEGDTFYFKDGENIYKYGNGERVSGSHVKYVNGDLTAGRPENADGEKLSDDEIFSEAKKSVVIGEDGAMYTYRFDGTTLKVWDSEDNIKTFEGDYSLLKQFGDKAYAVKDNVLYCFENADGPEPVELKYVDYKATTEISVGTAAQDLVTDYELTFVTVKAGTFLTAIDLTKPEGKDGYFILENTGEVPENTVAFETDKTALLLCYTGNAAIIAMGNTSYIVINDESSIQEKNIGCFQEPEYETATVTGDRIYASPFTVMGTAIKSNAAGTAVKIKHKLVYDDVLSFTYYEVVYDNGDGTEVTGYVAKEYLLNLPIKEDPQPPKEDPEYSEKNDVTTVLLILAVVILVLIAIGYIVYTATKKKKSGEEQPEEQTGIQPEEQSVIPNGETVNKPEEKEDGNDKKKKKGLFGIFNKDK